jgi:hypothetical protein
MVEDGDLKTHKVCTQISKSSAEFGKSTELIVRTNRIP